MQYSCKSIQYIAINNYCNNNRQINVNRIYNRNRVKISFKYKQINQITEYCKNKLISDRLQYSCKSCEIIARNNYRNNNNRKIITNRIYT